MMFRTIAGMIIIAVVVAPTGVARGQETQDNPPAARAPTGHLEVQDDPYVPIPRAGRLTSPAVPRTRNRYVSIQVNVDASGDNIVDDAANEPSIAVDPTDPNRMVIGWRQFDTITNNFRQAGWGYTQDGGQSWTFPGVIEPGVFRSDPVLDFDSQGNFYYNSLTNSPNYHCHVFKSTDGGVSWNAGTYAWGGDKQWMTIDRTSGIGQGNIYAAWNRFYSSCSGDFTRSYDGGQTFLACTNVPDNPYWGTLAVGPDGELYVCGIGFTVAKSTTLQDPGQPVQWDFSTTVSLDGSMEMSAGPNPGGLLGQAWIAVDHSTGPTRGNVYLLSSVERYSTPDPLDVMFARSTDGGSTWSSPVRINDDSTNSAWQWFSTMSVAPNGRIDVIWSDSRDDPGGYDSELYYAYSDDAGETWSPNEALSPAFDPHVGWPQQNKLGDYYDMVSDEFGADVAYAATFNGEQDVYYLRIQHGPAPPVVWDIAANTAVSMPVTITLPASDDGLPDPPAVLTYIITSLPAHGELTDPGNGPITAVPYTLTTNGVQVQYQPEIDYDGTDSFEFKANDGGVPPEGGDSNIATVTVTMGGPDWDPVAYDVEWSTGVSVPTDVPLLGSDPNGDPLFYVIESLPSEGSLSDPGAGAITAVPYELVGGSNLVHYEPPQGQNLQVTFDFSVRDATAGSNVATVTLMVGGPSIVYYFPMDSDPGWSTQGDWAFGQPTGGGGEFGGPDPTGGHFGNNVYGYNLDGDYTNNLSARYLTTPALDFTDATGVELRFWRWLGVESSLWDRAKMQVSNNGFTWTTLWENGAENMWDTSWTEMVFDLSAIADGKPMVFIRWAMGPTDDSNTYCGWNLDDVEIWALAPVSVPGDLDGDGDVDLVDYARFEPCLGGPNVMTPPSGCDAADFIKADLDQDEDVDLPDFAAFGMVFMQ